MTDYRIFKEINTFNIFQQFVNEYESKKILDFGGNRGNLLSYSNGKILDENYTCIDVSEESLNFLIYMHPRAKTVHWNRYNQMYNPFGNKQEPFPRFNLRGIFRLDSAFDIAFANSVFTHHDINEMLYCLTQLVYSADSVYFTYIDPFNYAIFDILDKTHDAISLTKSQIDKMQLHNLSYILDKTRVIHNNVSNEDYNSIWTVINTEYLTSIIYRHLEYLDSSVRVKITNGKTSGFNWMKIEVLNRLPVISIIGY